MFLQTQFSTTNCLTKDKKEDSMSTTLPIKNPEQLRLFKDFYQTEKPNVRNYTLIIMGLNSALRISDILMYATIC